MNIEEYREFCISKNGVTEEFPFGPDTLVYKVMGKLFALVPLELEIFTVSLKCNPVKSIELRDEHDYISGAFHMNKKHWNTVNCEICPTRLLQELTNHSYNLIVSGFPKKVKVQFDILNK